MTISNLLSLILVLAVAYGAVMGAVGLCLGWQFFHARRGVSPARRRRGAVVPPVGTVNAARFDRDGGRGDL